MTLPSSIRGFSATSPAAAERSNDAARAKGDFIDWRDAGTLWGLFRQRLKRCPDAIAYRDYDSASGQWRSHTWTDIAARADRLRGAFARAGLVPGDRVAIQLANGVDWVCLDLAAHGCGLAVVGLHTRESAAANAYVLGHCGARLLAIDTRTRWKELQSHRSLFPSLGEVWLQDGKDGPDGAAPDPAVRPLTDAIAGEPEPRPPRPGSPGELATLIYTSGTMGRPKGVMLSHFALMWNAQAAAAIVATRTDDVFLSILPLAHAFERTIGYYLPMMGGCTVAFARSPREVREDLAAIRPTVLLAVPRLFELMRDAIVSRAARNYVAYSALRIAAAVGWRRFQAIRQRGNAGIVARVLWPLLRRHVAGPVMAAFGGRLRAAISGGAPLNEAVGRLLIGLGLPVIEGYGLTEAAPVVAANSLEDNHPGSVGRPLPGVEVKLSPEGELLVRTPSVMSGYWKDDSETARTIDAAGWLSTGDLADIEDGLLFIRGRVKDMIVLSIGEKINPNVLEERIGQDPLVEQVVVIGNGRPFLVALAVLNASAWQRFAADNGIASDAPNDLTSRARMLARMNSSLADLPRFARVRAVHLALEPWTIELGLLTPTLKIKRDALQQRFAKEIASLFDKHDADNTG